MGLAGDYVCLGLAHTGLNRNFGRGFLISMRRNHICSMLETSEYHFLKDPLNLPVFDFEIKNVEGKLNIFDTLRKKFLILTPEEWVRQHIVRYLILHKQYPKSLFALEKGLKYNQIQKRFDILILDRAGQPFLLVECKAPDIRLSQHTAEQIAVYNKTLGARFLAISNGKTHLCLSFDEPTGTYCQLRDFPDF